MTADEIRKFFELEDSIRNAALRVADALRETLPLKEGEARQWTAEWHKCRFWRDCWVEKIERGNGDTIRITFSRWAGDAYECESIDVPFQAFEGEGNALAWAKDYWRGIYAAEAAEKAAAEAQQAQKKREADLAELARLKALYPEGK